MSKELEALEHLNNTAFYERGYNKSDKQAYLLLKEALKRNEPMKPKVAWKNEEDESIVAYRCSSCNGSLGAKLDDKPMFPNFCRHCGQALDWSDEK